MRSPVAGIVTLIVLLVVAIIAYSSLFTVQQTEQVLVVRFGKPVDIVTEPGLHFKAPFTDSVIPIDKRSAPDFTLVRPPRASEFPYLVPEKQAMSMGGRKSNGLCISGDSRRSLRPPY